MKRPSLSDLTPEQRQALVDFRRQYGNNWKYKLLGMWANGHDERLNNGALLRRIRNNFGPSWLSNLKEIPQ